MINYNNDLPYRTLKSLRIDKFLTQLQIAEKLGINRVTYAKYENKTWLPDIYMAFEISKVVEYPVDKILWW